MVNRAEGSAWRRSCQKARGPSRPALDGVLIGLLGAALLLLKITYFVTLVPVAAIGWLHPTYSAVAMLASSVAVLANSARLLR